MWKLSGSASWRRCLKIDSRSWMPSQQDMNANAIRNPQRFKWFFQRLVQNYFLLSFVVCIHTSYIYILSYCCLFVFFSSSMHQWSQERSSICLLIWDFYSVQLSNATSYNVCSCSHCRLIGITSFIWDCWSLPTFFPGCREHNSWWTPWSFSINGLGWTISPLTA